MILTLSILPLITQLIIQTNSAVASDSLLTTPDFSANNDSALTTEATTTSSSELPPLPLNSKLEVDLDSCLCMQNTTTCDILIARSTFMAINCPKDFSFCCTGRLKQNPPPPAAYPFDLSSDPNSFLINSEEEEEDEEEELSSSLTSSATPFVYTADKATLPDTPQLTSPNNSKRPKRRCTCKPRAQCPEEYKDYSFGFGCSHNTVRCCEPESSSSPTDSRLIFIQKPTPPLTSGNNDELFEEESDPQCYCLPPQDCERIEENVVWRREDTLCPHNLVKCCGSRTRSDVEEDSDDGDDDLAEDKIDLQLPFEGQGGFFQPIPLPELKIPMTEEDTDETEETMDYSKMPPTLPPPELPTYYNYQPPKYYSGYYNPGFRHEGRPVPSISGLPWPQQRYTPQESHEYPSHRSEYPSRVPQEETSDIYSNGDNDARRFKPEPSFFEKITGFIG